MCFLAELARAGAPKHDYKLYARQDSPALPAAHYSGAGAPLVGLPTFVARCR